MWAQVVTFTEISALCVAVNIIVTIFKLRAPGMSLNRIPLFVWAQLVVAFMIVFAMPAVATASTLMLATDRAVNMHWFNPAEGGDALLWQHMFWFFGHPEVYIIFLPALGMVSPIIETFCRRPVFGYTAIGDGEHRDGVLRVRPLGAPHVRDADPRARRESVHGGEHDDRDSDRRADLLLDRDDVGRRGRGSPCRCCSCSAFSSRSSTAESPA